MKNIFTITVITLLLIINICFAEQLITGRVTIKTPSGGMTFKQIHKEIKKQTGAVTLVDRPYKNVNFQEITLEINLVNVEVIEAFKEIEKKIQIKYDTKFIIKHEGNTFIAAHCDPKPPSLPSTRFVRLKYISCIKMKELIKQYSKGIKTAEDKNANGIIYYMENHDTISRLIEKYDIETINTNENLLKFISK
jgi:hypothetical protein